MLAAMPTEQNSSQPLDPTHHRSQQPKGYKPIHRQTSCFRYHGYYGCWGAEAMQMLSRLASRLATRGHCSKSQATCLLYGRLSLTLIRANAWALLSQDHLWKIHRTSCNISPFVCNVHLYYVSCNIIKMYNA